jgi:hypothetical protein
MDIFKKLGLGSLIFMIPGILTQVGMSFKNKDDNTTGNDDLAGNVIMAISPVIPAFLGGNDKLIITALRALRDVIDNYLASRAPSTP